MKAFIRNEYPTVGAEQEFHLIDVNTGELTPDIDAVLDAVDADLRDSVVPELFYAVLECKTPACKTVDELLTHLAGARLKLAKACEKVGVKLAAAGSHPFSAWQKLAAVDSGHYRWVMEQCVYLSQRLLAFGLHVHVGAESAGAAMYALNEMRRWAYPLMALSANSPYFEGRETGLASTRSHIFGSLPRTKMMPYFRDFTELEAYYEKLRAAGDVTQPSDLWWIVRPQPPLGTVEVRAFDMPTDVFRVAAFAAVVQAAVAFYQDRFRNGKPASVLQDQYLEENHWKAMRFGLDGDIIEPETGEVLLMRGHLGRLLEMVRPQAAELGSARYIDYLHQVLRDGNTESAWQTQTCRELGNDLVKLEFEIAKKTVEDL